MDNCITMIKYQGLGNDYLVLDPNKNRVQLQGKKIALLCQRGFGLGADGILYGPIEIDGKMGVRIFNSDGSEAAISGNGVRIFAKYLTLILPRRTSLICFTRSRSMPFGS